MNPSISRTLAILSLASAGLTGCVATKEGMLVTTTQPSDSANVLHAAASAARQYGLRPVYIDDSDRGPKTLGDFARFDGPRLVVVQKDPQHLWVGTNPFHETDSEGKKQAEVRTAVEVRLRALFPATALKEKYGYPAAHWVTEDI